MAWKHGAAAVVALLSLAQATPPDPGVTGTNIWQRTVGGKEFTLREIHIPPGADNGWHYHDGTLYVWVRHGTLSHFDTTCNADGVYQAGRFLVEPGGRDHVHTGRNLGTTEVVLEVLYVLPKGSPLSEDAPNPGCPFG